MTTDLTTRGLRCRSLLLHSSRHPRPNTFPFLLELSCHFGVERAIERVCGRPLSPPVGDSSSAESVVQCAGGAECAEQPLPSPPRLRQQLHTCTPSRSSQGSDGGLRGGGVQSHNNSASFRHTHHCRGTTAVPRLSLHLIRERIISLVSKPTNEWTMSLETRG